MPLNPKSVRVEVPFEDFRNLLSTAVAFRAQAEQERHKTRDYDNIDELIDRCRQINNETVALNGGDPNWMLDKSYLKD